MTDGRRESDGDAELPPQFRLTMRRTRRDEGMKGRRGEGMCRCEEAERMRWLMICVSLKVRLIDKSLS